MLPLYTACTEQQHAACGVRLPTPTSPPHSALPQALVVLPLGLNPPDDIPTLYVSVSDAIEIADEPRATDAPSNPDGVTYFTILIPRPLTVTVPKSLVVPVAATVNSMQHTLLDRMENDLDVLIYDALSSTLPIKHPPPSRHTALGPNETVTPVPEPFW